MTEQATIDDMNGVIARFMGINPVQRGTLTIGQIAKLQPKSESVAFLKYHQDWNMLMPVVEKIEQLSDLLVKKTWITINGYSCAIWTYFDVTDILRAHMPNDQFKVKQNGTTKIEATYKAVIQFIQWYQSIQPSQNKQ